MLQATASYIRAVDARCADLPETLSALRRMTLDEFGLLLLNLPNPELPHLSALLPRATPDEIQQKWTGASGEPLLQQSTAFVGFAALNYATLTGRNVREARVLDFGCGYGRLLRLMPYFVEPENLYGCDAWANSLGHAREAQLLAQLSLSDVFPADLPFEGTTFDFIYAFSIFTHLSERAASAALGAFRKRISPDGLAIITIRPPEFWPFIGARRNADYSELAQAHRSVGFAFLNANPDVPDAAYGDVSMSEAYLAEKFPEWQVARIGHDPIDPYQVLVCLRPR